jgi:hypothetical protein
LFTSRCGQYVVDEPLVSSGHANVAELAARILLLSRGL